MQTRPTLTDEQRKIFHAVLGNRKRHQVQSIGGYAGTGKTTIVAQLIDDLHAYSVCAFTGKAANVLRRKGVNASTIHSLIYHPEQDGKKVVFTRKERHEMSGVRGFIVDEASMVSEDVYNDLLSFDLPTIFVGDHGQLEPVGSAMNVMKDPMYRLETVHRNAGEIARFAEHLRCGFIASAFVPTEGKVAIVRSVPDESLGNADQVICAYNRTRCEVNQKIRAMRGHEGIIQVGERVICLRNKRDAGLFNGMQGTVETVGVGVMDMKTDEGYTIHDIDFDPKQFGQPKVREENHWQSGISPFDYAYCVTTHKAQGDEFNKVIVYEQKSDLWEHKRWAYTAASRAKELLIWVASPR